MATWFEITYTGEPTEADYARVAELAAQGFTSGQLLNEEEDYKPQEGDRVVFPDAPADWNRHTAYEVAAITPARIVFTYPDGGGYSLTWDEARAFGMRKAEA